MKIKLHTITIGEVLNGFVNNEEEGVFGYGGKLNIRPKYQREFVYDETKEKAVMDTIFKGYPLNVMYWVANDNGTYEVLDGQQRTLSFCNFYNGEYAIILNDRLAGMTNLTADEKKQFIEYPLQVYICSDGSDSERIAWFRTINLGGAVLTDQELLNATYPGAWIIDAKKIFSKTNCVAKGLADDLLGKKYIRQEALETVLKWIADRDGLSGSKAVEDYMRIHQNDKNADREWQYFQSVVAWVRTLFPKYRKEMKGLPWGLFYNKFRVNEYSATEIENRIKRLMMDDDVTNKKGIYNFILSGNENALSIRDFSDSMKRSAYERQNGICTKCGKHFDLDEMHADHITPWSKGGKTIPENCQMLCASCNRLKSNN